MYRKILVLVEPGPASGRAQRVAGDLALAYGAEVTLLGVARVHGTKFGMQHPSLFPNRRELNALKSDVQAAHERMRKRGVNASWTVTMAREPGKRLAKAAREAGCDLIVMAEPPQSRWGRVLLESPGANAVKHGGASVLVVRPEAAGS